MTRPVRARDNTLMLKSTGNAGTTARAGQRPALLAAPPEVLAGWWTPFGDHLAKERRCSGYTVRNYRQAVEDFDRWLNAQNLWDRGFDALTTREMRDFVIEGQRRFDRRTLHNHVSGLRTFFKFWLHRGRVTRNPLLNVPLH